MLILGAIAAVAVAGIVELAFLGNPLAGVVLLVLAVLALLLALFVAIREPDEEPGESVQTHSGRMEWKAPSQRDDIR
ncbi:hypothetical protein [Actinopolymorpha cephalotaxi]|uniref:Membrane protein implicated in regulation of membrane protease activity n=1 Tax=Actinopolymorpha cephalotaxi TaxID=504797 RepID=A0ABX2SDB0_9ACTN|nr:hypothetical protein [Actinopolymorpha cephalotaxi]NYH87341.1 membrane protein implicated in regulation of membrane protease activity [Actinopolymorpha cephalotaxi]